MVPYSTLCFITFDLTIKCYIRAYSIPLNLLFLNGFPSIPWHECSLNRGYGLGYHFLSHCYKIYYVGGVAFVIILNFLYLVDDRFFPHTRTANAIQCKFGICIDTHFTSDQHGQVDAEFTAGLSAWAVLALRLDNSLCGWLACALLAV